MRVLHVEGGRQLYGGARQALYLMEGLAARGVDNLLACREGCALAEAARPFAQVFELPMHGDVDLLLVPRLGKLIRRLKPSVVHLHSRIGADVMGGIAARLNGVPVVYSRRVDNPEPRWQVALKYRLHDRVIAISEAIGRVLLSEGLPDDKLRVVRSAVDTRAFDRGCDHRHINAALELPEDRLLIGVVAQLIERKGHRFLLDALPPLIEQFPRIQVRFFGQGALASDLDASISAAGLQAHVRLAGFRDDLERILPCMDLLVHPATMEGLGVSLLQASSAGVPIIAADAGGIPEAVHNEVNGLLFPPADVQALGIALRRLLSDTGLRHRLGEGGRTLMHNEFSVDAMVEGNLAVYRGVMDDG